MKDFELELIELMKKHNVIPISQSTNTSDNYYAQYIFRVDDNQFTVTVKELG